MTTNQMYIALGRALVARITAEGASADQPTLVAANWLLAGTDQEIEDRLTGILSLMTVFQVASPRLALTLARSAEMLDEDSPIRALIAAIEPGVQP